MVVAGRLLPGTSDQDVEAEIELAASQGMDPGKIDLLLFEQRHHKPRKSRHKLLIESVREATV